MFEQVFKNIDDTLRKDAGCSSALDYIEQTSWVLFLKYLDDYERDRQACAAADGNVYAPILDEDTFAWRKWAAPKSADGKPDNHSAMTGDDLKSFVDDKLFPYLRDFRDAAPDTQTLEYKIGEIFGELTNKIQSGYNLREVINQLDKLRFRLLKDKHEMSHLYESRLQSMGNAGRNGGEYYTPRPLIQAIVRVVAPQVGQTVYDGAAGSAGFLCEAYEYLLDSLKQEKGDLVDSEELETLKKRTFNGKEKKSLAYIIGIMNMILHGIEVPNIIHTNTLAQSIDTIQERDRYDIVLTNPPFGGKERDEVRENFPIQSGETAFLFLQHFIKILRAGGRAGVVIKNTFLSNSDAASLRRHLLRTCQLHTILDMPSGTFQGAGVKTVVLFFTKGQETQRIWYYQLDPQRNLGKGNPLTTADLEEFTQLQAFKAESPYSWTVEMADIDKENYDLSVRNPHIPQEKPLRAVPEIAAEMRALDAEAGEILGSLEELVAESREENL